MNNTETQKHFEYIKYIRAQGIALEEAKQGRIRDLEEIVGTLPPATMQAIDDAARQVELIYNGVVR